MKALSSGLNTVVALLFGLCATLGLLMFVMMLCACAPERPQTLLGSPFVVTPPIHHSAPPPGCEIIQDHPGFYAVSIPVQSVSVGADGATVKVTGHYSLAPYALYDTRQGAVDCAWLCYRPASDK